MSNNTTTRSDAHEKTWQNLPWYVNATLDVEEQALVELHLGECITCRREFESLKQLASVVATRHVDPKCENALEQLHVRMDDSQQQASTPWAVAVVLTLAIGLVGLIVGSAVNNDWLNAGDGYTTLGTRALENEFNSSRTARIVFRHDVDAAELVGLLDLVDATVADGPSLRGAYTIKFQESASWTEQQQAIDRLRGSGRVVLVEPVAVTLNEHEFR